MSLLCQFMDLNAFSSARKQLLLILLIDSKKIPTKHSTGRKSRCVPFAPVSFVVRHPALSHETATQLTTTALAQVDSEDTWGTGHSSMVEISTKPLMNGKKRLLRNIVRGLHCPAQERLNSQTSTIRRGDVNDS